MKKSTKTTRFTKYGLRGTSKTLASLILPAGAGMVLLGIVFSVFGVDQALASQAPTEVFGGGEVSPVTRFLGGLHPLSVHFPLALIFAAFVFELVFVIGGDSKWRTSAFHTLALGAVISLATISLGLMASEVGPFLGPDAELVGLHRIFGLLTAALSLVATYSLAQSKMPGKARAKKAKTFELTYRITLALATLTVFIAGHFGAELAGL